jgi:uncharacterized membrane protein
VTRSARSARAKNALSAPIQLSRDDRPSVPGRLHLTIGGAWIAHHGLTDQLGRVDSIFLRLNLIFLLGIAFLPFPTSLVVEALHKSTAWERLAAVVYGLTLLVIRLLFSAMGEYARRKDLRRPGVDDPDLDEAHKKFRYAVVAYVLTILVGLLVPAVAIFLYFAVAVYLFVPFGTDYRAIIGKAE